MYFTIVDYLLPNTQSSFNAQVLLVAFAAVTIFTQNVSSEISNHIEQVAKDASRQATVTLTAAAHKDLEKSTTTIAITDVLKANDTEKSRRSRYLRTMTLPTRPSSSILHRSSVQRSAAAAAVAAAAVADEDLRHFGKISKYHAVPYDGRKNFAGVSMGLPLRQIHGANTRYRYVNDDVRAPTSAGNKWRSFPSRYASTMDESLSPYDAGEYYENGQTITMGENDGDGDQEDADDWSYREISKKERDIPVAFEDAEPALSLKHAALAKRRPFANHRNNFQLYPPNTVAHGAVVVGDVDLVDVAGGGDRRYKTYTPNRGRGEENLELTGEWLSGGGGGGGGGGKRSSAVAVLKRNRLRGSGTGDRLSSAFTSHKSQSSKHALFEAHDSRHRFKFDGSARTPTKGIREIIGGGGGSSGHKKRYRDRVRYSPSMGMAAAFNRDDLPAKEYEATSDVANEHENQVAAAISLKRRPFQQFIQSDDEEGDGDGDGDGDSDSDSDDGDKSYNDNDNDHVVYSSRYRNKQAAAAAAAAAAATADHSIDTSQHTIVHHVGNAADSEADADETDPSRLFFGHRHRPVAPRLAKKSKLVLSNATKRKSASNAANVNGNRNGDYALPSFVSTVEDASDMGENKWPKFNYKLSKPITSTPSSFFFSSPAVSSSSSSNNHRPSVLASSTNFTTSNTRLLDFEYDYNSLKTRDGSYGSGGGVPSTANDVNAVSHFEGENENENENGNKAEAGVERIKSDGGISAGELIAYMSASPSETVVSKQDRYAKSPALLSPGPGPGAYPFVRTFSEQRDQLESNFYQPASLRLPSAFGDQDFEINLD